MGAPIQDTFIFKGFRVNLVVFHTNFMLNIICSQYQNGSNMSTSMDEAEAIYRESIIIDMRGMPRLTPVGVRDFKESGITMANIQADSEESLWLQNWLIDKFDEVALVKKAQDVFDAKERGTMSVLLSMEHPTPLSHACNDYHPALTPHLEKLEWYYSLGLRRVQLSYNRRTMFANGCTERNDSGLSFYGAELVEKMNELGMLVDCGHVGIQSSIDAVEVSKKPITYSHTGCRAVYDHPRSKTDEALKALAEKGGVAGIYILPFFISGKPMEAGLRDVLNHIEHAVEVMGIEHVGIGSDQGIMDRSRFPSFDQAGLTHSFQPSRLKGYEHFTNEIDVQPPRYMPELAHTDYMLSITRGLLSRGYSKRDVKLVLGENFVRLMKEVL